MKAEEVGELREQTLGENRERWSRRRAALRRCFERGGKLLALGNGGSATDAMDLVADLRYPPRRRLARRGRRSTSPRTPAIITAIGNDVGIEEIFQRQVIAYGREGDALARALDQRQLAQRDRGAGRGASARDADDRLVGYDGGRVAAEGLADHVVITRSQHIPRIQEAQASAYHALRELIELTGDAVAVTADRGGGVARSGSSGTVQGVGFRPFVYRLATSSGWAAASSTTSAACWSRSRATPRAVDGLPRAPGRRRRRRWRRSSGVAPEELGAERRARVRILAERALGGAGRARSPRTPPPAPTASPSSSTPRDRRHRYPFVNCTNCGPRFTIVARRPLRPAADDDGGLRDVRAPAGPSTRTRSTAASTRSRTPARTAGRAPGWSDADGRAHRRARRLADAVAAAARGAGRRADRRGQGHRRIPPRLPRRRRARGRRAALAQAPRGQAVRADGRRTSTPPRELVELGDGGGRACCSSRERPIVLARRRAGRRIAAGVAPRSASSGVMLPYSPLHHLLLADAGGAAGDDQRQRLRRADRLPRRRRARAARRDRRPVPHPRPPDPHPHRRLRRSARSTGRSAAGAAARCGARAATCPELDRCRSSAARTCWPAGPS